MGVLSKKENLTKAENRLTKKSDLSNESQKAPRVPEQGLLVDISLLILPSKRIVVQLSLCPNGTPER